MIHEAGKRFSIYDPARGLVLKDPLYDRDLNNFSPRASFAWDLQGKGTTVLRGGFGMFHDAFSQDFFIWQIPWNCYNCPGVAYNPIGRDPVFLSLSPVATIVPNEPVFDPVTTSPGSPDTTDVFTVDNIRTPYIFNYNFNLQQQLFRNTVLQVGYVGSSGHKLFRIRDINQATQAAIDAWDPANGCCVPRPFDTKAVLSPLAPNPPFYVDQLETAANSNYHSLQISLAQRNWHGWSQELSFTWAHSIDGASDGQDFVPNAAQPNDSTNARGDRGSSNFDVRRRFVWSLTYDLPAWKSLGRLGSGWQVSTVLTLMSGHPFHVNYNFQGDWDGSGEFFGRPDVVGAPRYNRDDPFRFLDLSSFKVPCTLDGSGDTSEAACVQGSRHFGTLGRNSLLGPDYRNFDFAVVKETAISERVKLQFRADFFNLTNHPNFASPLLPAFIADAAFNGIGPTGHSLGYLPITQTSDIGLGNPILGGGGPRSVQFALKLVF